MHTEYALYYRKKLRVSRFVDYIKKVLICKKNMAATDVTGSSEIFSVVENHQVAIP